MARKRTNKVAPALLGKEAFLRSINLVYDADEPERIAHFFPTEKSSALISKLMGDEPDRAFLVVAPYGSGKSLAGAYAIHAVENRKEARPILKGLNARMADVHPKLSEALSARLKTWATQGLTLSLVGHTEDVVRGLLNAAIASFDRLGKAAQAKKIRVAIAHRSPDMVTALELLKGAVETAKLDRIVILWDEFGRHLETLISEGKASELLDLQTLAEFVARQKKRRCTLALFLHQGLLDYASNLPQIVRREWKKIEGRFVTVDYVEDSKEIYRLIGDILLDQYGGTTVAKSVFFKKAKQLREAGRFSGFTQTELAALIYKASPLSPAALELLPRIAARVSQNERTLFSYLFSLQQAADEGEIGADSLYDYFSEQMQADIEVGGTHRQWLETQSALSKVAGDFEAENALKTICLLGLGLSGERTKTTRNQAALASAGFGAVGAAEETIDLLIKRKLLLYRKHSDEVAVWHGTDLDLRGRLEENKAAQEAGFDLLDFLSKEAHPPIWKPQEYNDDYSIRRFFRSEFITVDRLEERSQLSSANPDHLGRLAPNTDGKIYYVIPSSAEEATWAEEILVGAVAHDLFGPQLSRQIVFALSAEVLPITEAALEIYCLLQMERDSELTSQDPLVVPEIQQMLDDARAQLQRLIDRLTNPQSGGPRWLYQGVAHEIGSPRVLRRFLSNITREVYPLTPRIRSEVIVRNKPSAPVVNSRKKLMMGILERNGQEMFGIQGNFPDASMARTVLIETGLYRPTKNSGRWAFAAPSAVSDKGLQKVWKIVHDFFTEPSEEGKSPRELFETLAAPPYGVRPGLMPIFFGAGLKAFSFTTSLLRDGEYVADVLPSNIEDVFKEPDRHLLKVLELTSCQRKFLARTRKLFGSHVHDGDEQDLIRQTHESLQFWYSQTDEAAKTTRMLSKPARDFRDAVKRQRDPVALLFEDFPRITGNTVADLARQTPFSLLSLKEEVDQLVPRYIEIAQTSIRQALKATDDPRSLTECIQGWAESFFEAVPPGHPGRPTLKRALMGYDSDKTLTESVVAGVVGGSLRHWNDEEIKAFDQKFTELVVSVESAALGGNLNKFAGEKTGEAMTNLLQHRIRAYAKKLAELSPDTKIEDILRDLLAKNPKH